MTVKEKIEDIVRRTAIVAHEKGALPSADIPVFTVEEPKAEAHGDLSTNLAMVMASVQKMAPRKIAGILLDHLNDPEGLIEKTEIAGPGFINFFIRTAAWHPLLREIHEKDRHYGASNIGSGRKVQVEFVSSNPTGPLHVGHGRGAAVGDSLAAILECSGYDVQREYYINDSGRQISTLGASTFLRYKELAGETVDFPEEYYQGDYIRDLAGEIRAEKGDGLLRQSETEATAYCGRYAAGRILAGIREDLDIFGVRFDNWFSEQSLYDAGKVEQVIQEFREKGQIYEKDGALWFRTSDYGDEKDRVVVRQNGQTTYFASDIAYHVDKYERGLEWVIDVWGADHHGYIPRMSAAVEATGHEREQFDVVLVQLVNLLRGGVPVAMSSRKGEFVTLREVVDEVGRDAARFIFLTRHHDSKLDFDLELAKQKTSDNPVYYVQYVHARISGIREKAAERGITEENRQASAIARLDTPEDVQLIKTLIRYPDVVATAARQREPHRIPYFLMNLAAAFHGYYNRHRVLNEDAELTAGRLYLVLAVQKVIRNGLSLLGVSAPEQM